MTDEQIDALLYPDAGPQAIAELRRLAPTAMKARRKDFRAGMLEAARIADETDDDYSMASRSYVNGGADMRASIVTAIREAANEG